MPNFIYIPGNTPTTNSTVPGAWYLPVTSQTATCATISVLPTSISVRSSFPTAAWTTLTEIVDDATARWYVHDGNYGAGTGDLFWSRQTRLAAREAAAAPAIIRERSEETDRREREIVARINDQRRLREEAQERARTLLLDHLTPEQQETVARNNWFMVEGRQRYRIRTDRGMSANIDVLDQADRVTHRLCGHCDPTVPLGDQYLAQKIMLQFAEDDFLRIANFHPPQSR